MTTEIESDLEAILHTEDEDSQAVTVSPEDDQRIAKALDKRVLPIVCALYVLSYIDRGNIGNAKTAGAQESLGLSSSQWAWVLNSFYICYICFEWTTMFWKIFPAHIFVSLLCVCWGAAAMSSGAVHNLAQLIATRSLLGVFEATFGAGAPYFLSTLYRREELGFRMSLMLGMSPLANTFASSLAYGITQIKGSLEPWRLLFIIEGALTVAFAPVVYFLLIDSASSARFLTPADRLLAAKRLHLKDTTSSTSKTGVHRRQVLAALADYKTYAHTAMHFCANYSFAALSNFLPTIVRDMGYDPVTAQGLVAPAYFTAFLACVGASYLSDRRGNRGFVMAGAAAVGTAGYGMLAGIRDRRWTGARYAGVWLAACGVFPALSLNLTWLLNNHGGDSKKGAGLAVALVFGQCSSFISSTVFPSEDGPFYTKGCAIGCAMTGLMVVLSLAMHYALEWENRKRDELYGRKDARQELDVTDEGDENRYFRYLT